ncbi:MAG: septum formation inhibitor Maf [Desulfobacteraceae bacterium]|nr:septum formation inhibitor Maf [Desulfobacteraceae bacterium]
MRNAHEKRIILASKSPRRKYLLEQAGIEFTIEPSNFDESSVPVCAPDDYVKTLAMKKANDISGRYTDSWIIGADTVVLIDGIVLGKPTSPDDARRMLMTLSGQTHQVLTGYAILCRSMNRQFADVVRTDVRFKTLSKTEIEWYIRTGEPFDKAGAYAIQGLGTSLVRRISGSYTNVVGLPVCEVIEILIKEKVIEMNLPAPEALSN